MTTTVPQSRIEDSDIRLWMIAFAMSVIINVLIVLAMALWVLDALMLSSRIPETAPSESKERIATIMPEWSPVPDASNPSPEKQFTRTAPDQTAPEPPKNAAFEGERNTQATSDRTPVIDAPELPSQQGIEPLDERDFETTESNYKDGTLDQPDVPENATTPVPPVTAPPITPPVPELTTPAPAEPVALPPQREKAFEGPKPIEVAAQPDQESPDEIKKPQETPPQPKSAEPSNTQETVKPTPRPPAKIDDPAFSGFQQKTAIIGSISRTGRSSLDVEDSPMGRYQAAISRAVELEWQRNCVRHRDFITPGFLTVRFFVEASGKVRSVQFVGDMETGEVQKGFTLNSIRDAPIPKMPDAVRKSQDGNPLELVFRFYF